MPASLARLGPAFLLVLLAYGVGCGSSNPASAPSDAATIEAEDIERDTNQRIDQLLVRNVPGIQVIERGGRLVVRLRGPNSFLGDSRPLFVVDGMPVEPESDGSLPGVTIPEIERIEVLKDPAETSMYGMRGANGVIVVTTKRGQRNQ